MRRADRRGALVLGWILLAGIVVQAVAILRAEVPGLDAVVVVETAGRIEKEGMGTTLQAGQRQILFPATVAALHGLLEPWTGPQPWLWVASAQMAAGLALVFTVLPLAGLARRLVSEQAAWVACGGLMVLPKMVEMGPYGISDSLHLLLFTTATWAIVAGLSARTAWRAAPWWALAGLCTTAALLTRAEAIVLAGATPLFLLGQALRPFGGTSRRTALAGLAVYSVCFCASFGLLTVASQPTSVREAVEWAMGWGEREPPSVESAGPAELWLADEPPGAFAVKDPGEQIRERGWAAALRQYVLGLGEILWYVPGVLALVGLIRLRRQATPADWFCRILFVLFSCLVITYAAGAGYVRPRHLAVLAVLALPCVLPALEWLVAPWKQRPAETRGLGRVGWGVAVLMAAGCLFWATQPIQPRQAGYRQAARWLGEHGEEDALVLDTRGWTGLYSGHPTRNYRDARQVLADPRLAYLVVGRDEVQASSPRAAMLRQLLEKRGRLISCFPQTPYTTEHSVVVLVYRWTPLGLAGHPPDRR